MTPAGSVQPDGNALLQAVKWIETVALGPIATIIATLAVAAIGLGMLGGRIPAKRGFTAVLGCFIIFGAPSISLGLMTTASGMGGATYRDDVAVVAAPQPQLSPVVAAPPQPIPVVPPQSRPIPPPIPPSYDPYAGASVQP